MQGAGDGIRIMAFQDVGGYPVHMYAEVLADVEHFRHDIMTVLDDLPDHCTLARGEESEHGADAQKGKPDGQEDRRDCRDIPAAVRLHLRDVAGKDDAEQREDAADQKKHECGDVQNADSIFDLSGFHDGSFHAA